MHNQDPLVVAVYSNHQDVPLTFSSSRRYLTPVSQKPPESSISSLACRLTHLGFLPAIVQASLLIAEASLQSSQAAFDSANAEAGLQHEASQAGMQLLQASLDEKEGALVQIKVEAAAFKVGWQGLTGIEVGDTSTSLMPTIHNQS